MRILFSLFNPYNIFYLLFNKPISHVSIKCTFKYYLRILGIWLILAFLAFLFIGPKISLDIFNNYWLSILILLLIMQTLMVITFPLKLYRVYLTTTSIVQTIWFIKIVEIKRNDIFAIDINKKNNLTALHFFIVDRLMGNVVMERIISDTKDGFYIEPTVEFIESIKGNINSNLLTPEVLNYPNITETKDLRSDIYKVTFKNKASYITYFLLLLFHPFSVFLILEYLNNLFLLNLFLSSLLLPVLDYIRAKLSDVMVRITNSTSSMDKIYGNYPIAERINFLRNMIKKP